MFADHLHLAAKLFQAAFTKITASASDEIVNANAISRREVCKLRANFFHATRDFVPECEWQRINLRNAGPIVRIRVTDPGSRDANENVRRPDLGNWNVRLLERFSDLHELHRPHFVSASRVLNPLSQRNELATDRLAYADQCF